MQGINMHGLDSADLDNINLLDVIPNTKESEKDIYTFQDFKQWFNSIDLNEAVVQPIKKTKLKRPKSFQVQQSVFKIVHSNHMGGDSPNYTRQLLVAGPVLELGLKKKKQSFQSKDPFQVQDERQNSIRQSSARSSRSFNGYEQINRYQLKQRLGKGAFSQVYQGIDVESEDKKKYAIKIMDSKRLRKKFFRKNSHQLKESSVPQLNVAVNDFPIQSSFRQDQQSQSSEFVNNQIALLKKIDHEFITKLYEVIVDKQKGKAYLVLEYCENGFICENKSKFAGHSYRKLSQADCKKYFKQLALAINYIHTVVKIAHRDIKPENILISKDDQVKLSDFGLGTDQLETDQHSGTKLFMPPQNSGAQGRKVIKTQATDIWATGVTLLIMLNGSTPDYKDNAIVDLNQKIDQLKDVSLELKNFLNMCLEPDPQKRMTSEGMLLHNWIAGDDPFYFIVQKSLVKQFQIAVSKQQETQAIKDVQLRRPRQKNYVVSLAV